MRKIQWRVVVPWTLFFVAVAALPVIADFVADGQPVGTAQVVAGQDEDGNAMIPGLVARALMVNADGSTVSIGDGGPIADALGTAGDASATSDTGSFSLISLTKRVATHLTRLWQGPNASCAHLRGSGATSVAANSSGTSLDAGATGTGYWSSVTNLGRTFSIEITDDTGSTILPPLQSFTWSVPAAATPDNVTVKNNCAICSVSAATYASITTCDDD